MKTKYVIRRINRYNDSVEYYRESVVYGIMWVKDIRNAKHYNFKITIPPYILNHVDLNVCDIDVIQTTGDIGTYLSPKNKKHTLKYHLENILCILLIPILIPIVGIIDIKDKIQKLYKNKK